MTEDKIEFHKKNISQARNAIKESINQSEKYIQNKYDNIEKKYTSIKDTLDVSSKFRDHFWLTTGTLIGAGFLLSKIPFNSTSISLTDKQILKLQKHFDKNLSQKIINSQKPTASFGSSHILGFLSKPSVLASLANVAASVMTHRRFDENSQSSHHYGEDLERNDDVIH